MHGFKYGRPAMLVALLWSAFFVLPLHSAEEAPHVPLKSPFSTPVDMKTTAHFHSKYSDGKIWDQEIKTRYQWDGVTAYATELVKNPKTPNSERTSRSDCLYRPGELVRIHTILSGTTIEQTGAVFVTSKNSATQRLITPGEIFEAYSDGFGVAGYFDGYFYDDYFSRGAEVRSEQLGDVIHVSGQSKYGKAEAWLDSANGHLPQRVLINKAPEHYTTSGRIIRGVRFDQNDPRSDLVSSTLEIKDVKFNKDKQGQPYIQECTQLLTKTSQRGIESEASVRWTVDEIEFNPAFDSGSIYPHDAIKDRQDVTAEGASQLPFRWSQKARWVVPAANDLAASGAGGARTFRFQWLLLVNFGMLASLLAWWIYQRGRIRHGA
ncbi:MAG: hypothetical protein AABP62_20585 [Planctomycetota bacterium]